MVDFMEMGVPLFQETAISFLGKVRESGVRSNTDIRSLKSATSTEKKTKRIHSKLCCIAPTFRTLTFCSKYMHPLFHDVFLPAVNKALVFGRWYSLCSRLVAVPADHSAYLLERFQLNWRQTCCRGSQHLTRATLEHDSNK